MSRLALVGIASLLAVLAVPAAGGTDPCAVVPRAEVEKLLGVAITAAHPSGPATDEESGGMLSRCVFRTASAAVILTYVEFTSAAGASTWYKSGLAESQGDAGTKVSMDEKAGATAFWATTQAGEGYTLAHARYVVAAGAGGPGFHPLSGQPLRLLALELDKRLQP